MAEPIIDEAVDLAKAAVPGLNLTNLAIKIACGLGIAACAAFVIWKVFFAGHAAQQVHDQVQAHAQALVGNAEGAAGAHAANVVANSAAKEDKIHEITHDHYMEITKQPGASDPVPDAVWNAFRQSVCMRVSAAGLPDCQRLQKADPGQLESGSP